MTINTAGMAPKKKVLPISYGERKDSFSKLPARIQTTVRGLRSDINFTPPVEKRITNHRREGYINRVYKLDQNTFFKLYTPTAGKTLEQIRRRVCFEVGMQLMGLALCLANPKLGISVPPVRIWGTCTTADGVGAFIAMEAARGITLKAWARSNGCVSPEIYGRLRCFVDRMIDSQFLHGGYGFERHKTLPPECGKEENEASIVTGCASENKN